MKNKCRFIIILVIFLVVTSCSFVTVLEPTPEPTPTLQPGAPDYGWSLFSGDGMEIWLPDSFIGGNPRTDTPRIVAEIEALGSDFQYLTDTLEQNTDVFNLIAFDTSEIVNSTLTNMNISVQRDMGSMTFDEYIDLSMSQLPDTYSLQESSTTTVNGYEAGYMEVFVDSSADDCMAKVNIVRVDNDLWVVTFISISEEYEYWEPIFDQSLQTFTIVPPIDQITSPASGVEIPEGWVRFSGEYVVLWLPPSFEAADPIEDFDFVMNVLDNYFPLVTEDARETPGEFPWGLEVEAIDRSSQTELPPSVISLLSSISAYEDIAEESFNENASRTTSEYYEFVEQEGLTIGGYDAFRRITREEINGIQCYGVLYTIKVDRAVYTVLFTASTDEYESLLPLFDQIIQTFTALPN